MLFSILPILKRKQQHTKAFAVLFTNMFVVHFVRTPYRFSVPAFCLTENFKALVNKNIMYHKVGKTVGKYPEANRKAYLQNVILPQQKESYAYQGIKYEKSIIPFKPGVVVFFVVVFVQYP